MPRRVNDNDKVENNPEDCNQILLASRKYFRLHVDIEPRVAFASVVVDGT